MYLKTIYDGDGCWRGAVFSGNNVLLGYLMDITPRVLSQVENEDFLFDTMFSTETSVTLQYKAYCEYLIKEEQRKKECEAKSKTYEYKDGEVVPYELPF